MEIEGNSESLVEALRRREPAAQEEIYKKIQILVPPRYKRISTEFRFFLSQDLETTILPDIQHQIWIKLMKRLESESKRQEFVADFDKHLKDLIKTTIKSLMKKKVRARSGSMTKLEADDYRVKEMSFNKNRAKLRPFIMDAFDSSELVTSQVESRNPESSPFSQENQEFVEKLLAALTEKDRDAVVMSLLGHSQREIATELKISVEAVGKRLDKAIKKAKEIREPKAPKTILKARSPLRSKG